MQKKKPALGAAFSHARKVEAKTDGGHKKQRAVAAAYLKRKGMLAMSKSTVRDVLGHTASGKAVFSHTTASHGLYRHFTPRDHFEASDVAKKAGEAAHDAYNINVHYRNAKSHLDQAVKKTRAASAASKIITVPKTPDVKELTKSAAITLGAYQSAIAASSAPGHLSDDDKYAMERYRQMFDQQHAAIAQAQAEAFARMLAAQARR